MSKRVLMSFDEVYAKPKLTVTVIEAREWPSRRDVREMKRHVGRSDGGSPGVSRPAQPRAEARVRRRMAAASRRRNRQ